MIWKINLWNKNKHTLNENPQKKSFITFFKLKCELILSLLTTLKLEQIVRKFGMKFFLKAKVSGKNQG